MKHTTFKTAAEFRAAAHETLEYIATRIGRNGEQMERILFGWETIDREDAEEFIDALHMKPLRFWRVIVSPDPNSDKENSKRDLDVWELTRSVMGYIRDTIDPHIEFIVAEHNDHTEIPHAQGLVFFQGRLTKHTLNRMREIAIEQALAQRRIRDLVQTHQRTQGRRHKATAMRTSSSQRSSGTAGGRASKWGSDNALLAREHGMRRGGRLSRPLTPTLSCDQCDYKNQMVKLKDGKYWCPVCGKVRERHQGLSL